MIKKIRQGLKNLTTRLLQWEARLVLRRYRPQIIAITGNAGKTSTKEAVYQVLVPNFSVGKSPKSYNSEIGLPLAILGLDNAWGNAFHWLHNLVAGLGLTLLKHSYPQKLVLELGVDRPGDMASVIGWLRCDYAILTSLPNLPVHIEFFASANDLHREKALIFRSLKPGGKAILNADDANVMQFKKDLAAPVITYGFSPAADVRAHSWQIIYEEGDKKLGRWRLPMGVSFKLETKNGSVPVRIGGLSGKHQLYAPLAATAVALDHGLLLVEVAKRIESYTLPAGRLRFVKGINHSLILDDSYNASPAAAAEALQTLHDLGATGGRRVAVLGDMLDLGGEAMRAHREVGQLATRSADFLITVGQRAKFIHDEAEHKRFGKRKLRHFTDREGAIAFLKEFIKEGDVILVKGSQGARLEKIVEQIMLEPERKRELLCRQEPEWQKR